MSDSSYFGMMSSLGSKAFDYLGLQSAASQVPKEVKRPKHAERGHLFEKEPTSIKNKETDKYERIQNDMLNKPFEAVPLEDLHKTLKVIY